MEQNNQSTDIVVSETTLLAFQDAIDKCEPVVAKASHTIQDSLTIANGILHIKAFLNVPDVKRLIEGLQESTTGFLTDRNPLTLKKQNAKKPPQYHKQEYSYDEIVEALTPCLMEGYRMTGNEINIIAGKGMPVKAGKFRKIIEMPEVNNFRHIVGSPEINGSIAKMRCQATWLLGDSKQSIGLDKEDICIIAVEKGQYDGIDKLVGLAESKLFSRVLSRMMGKIVIEGDLPDPIDITPEKKPKMPSNNTTKTETVKKEADPLIEEWANLYRNLGTDKGQTDFERECPGPYIGDLPSEDRPSRLNELKTFLQGK